VEIETICNVATASAAIVAIGLAAYTFWHQTNQSRRTLGITLLHEMAQKFFESPEHLLLRRNVAKYLKTREPGDPVPSEVYDLLDFFDMLGFYHRTEIADSEMTWTLFYYWVSNYCTALEPEMEAFRVRHDGVSFHENCPIMAKALQSYGMRKKGLTVRDPKRQQEQFEEFLEWEIDDPGHAARGLLARAHAAAATTSALPESPVASSPN
jgi:hypothetical protein